MTKLKDSLPKVFKYTLGATVVALVSCGQQDLYEPNQDALEVEQSSEDGFTFQEMGLASQSGVVTVKYTTYFKVSTAQSSSLSSSQKCIFSKDATAKFSYIGSVSSAHRKVKLTEGIPGCGFKEGYFYDPHITFEKTPEFSLVTKHNTVFKISKSQSSDLEDHELCEVFANTKLYMKKAGQVDGVHVKVSLAKNSDFECGFTEGYFYKPHLKSVDLGEDKPKDPENPDSPEASFGKVMKHILLWEGKCSDHPNDPGGRTYMGITTERARLNGWYKDVCTMPYDMVLSIYKKDYWNKRAYKFSWPLNLAVMNTEVNSGGGRAQQFLDRMYARGISGTLQQKASWFVDQQTDFYRLIADRNPKLRVFLRGWLNRSNHMQDVIWGRKSLALAHVDSSVEKGDPLFGGAKAVEDEFELED